MYALIDCLEDTVDDDGIVATSDAAKCKNILTASSGVPTCLDSLEMSSASLLPEEYSLDKNAGWTSACCVTRAARNTVGVRNVPPFGNGGRSLGACGTRGRSEGRG
jgi:hypothetical protein